LENLGRWRAPDRDAEGAEGPRRAETPRGRRVAETRGCAEGAERPYAAVQRLRGAAQGPQRCSACAAPPRGRAARLNLSPRLCASRPLRPLCVSGRMQITD
jgi:hypothetical protein